MSSPTPERGFERQGIVTVVPDCLTTEARQKFARTSYWRIYCNIAYISNSKNTTISNLGLAPLISANLKVANFNAIL